MVNFRNFNLLLTQSNVIWRVKLYFTANTVEENKQVPILLSSIGPSTYALLCNLLAPDSPGSKSLKDIETALCTHFKPRRSVIAERFHFHKRDQSATETITDFDAALRKLAIHCNFGDTLEDTLRDCFVCELRQEAIQRRLLTETELTYTKALEIARGMEAAAQQTKHFRESDPTATLKTIVSPTKYPSNRPCYCCGRNNHTAENCKFKSSTCHSCGKAGHIAPVCRSNPTKGKKPQKPPLRKHRKTNLVDNTHQDDSDSSITESKMHQVTRTTAELIMVPLTLNGQELQMEVDTGAALSIISEATCRSLFPREKLHPTQLILKTYTDDPLEVKGKLHMNVQYGDQGEKLALVVVGGNGPSLLGRNCLKYIRLNWRKIFRGCCRQPLYCFHFDFRYVTLVQ